MVMDVLAPESLQQLQLKSFPSSARAGSSTYDVGFNCIEPSPNLSHAHGHLAGSEAEDSHPGCWHPIQAAQQGEEAEDRGECLHAAAGCEHSRCLADLPKEDNLALLPFLNDTMEMLLKIHTFYIVLIHEYTYFKPHTDYCLSPIAFLLFMCKRKKSNEAKYVREDPKRSKKTPQTKNKKTKQKSKRLHVKTKFF